MEMKKQGTGEAQGTARAASKTSAGKKQAGEQTPTSTNQAASGGEQDLLQHAKQASGEIVNQVQERAGSQLTRQKESAATDLSHVVNAVRRFGETLSAEEGGPIARYAAQYGDKAANSLERLSTYIREQDPKQLLGDVQNFGRRRPALLLGGAFLLGFAGARLIKSSMDTASQQQSYGTNVHQPNYTARNQPAQRPLTTPNAL